MANFYMFVAFFLSCHLFVPDSVQSKNVSDNSEGLKNEASLASNIGSDKSHLFGFGNKSHNDYECDCGWASYGCSYDVFDKKICKCDWGYTQNADKCERCYCGPMSDKCYFENGKKKCSCYGKYKQNKLDECEECDCGYESVSCHFSGYSKVCTCRDGYIVEYGKCERCDCGAMATSCELTSDKYTRCTCASGYVAVRRTWKMNEHCTLPGTGPSGWMIATYIESVFFALIIIACTISICYKRAISG